MEVWKRRASSSHWALRDWRGAARRSSRSVDSSRLSALQLGEGGGAFGSAGGAGDGEGEHGFELGGDRPSSVTRWRDSASEMVPRAWAMWSARRKRAVSWAVKALVEATPISGPALVVMVPCGFAGDGGADDVADGEGFGAFADELGLGGEGVGGLAGLGDEEADGVGVGDGVAVAVLGGVVDVDGEAGEALDHELAGEAGVPGGSAGGDGDLARLPGTRQVRFVCRGGRPCRCRARRGRGWCRGWRGAAR